MEQADPAVREGLQAEFDRAVAESVRVGCKPDAWKVFEADLVPPVRLDDVATRLQHFEEAAEKVKAECRSRGLELDDRTDKLIIAHFLKRAGRGGRDVGTT